jgi:hypothetical protein
LFQCTFSGSQVADIYMDRDTRVPAGAEWNLVGPTLVVAAADFDSAYAGEDTTRIELIVDGSLRTSGSSSDRVTFTSTAKDSTNGNDWYGPSTHAMSRRVI